MVELEKAARDFLRHRRLAVAGVSRTGSNPANLIYRRLRREGYQVFPVNPGASEVEGDPCHPSVGRIPQGVEGVVIATPPEAAGEVVRDCVGAGVTRLWIHRSFGAGSVSREAVEMCEAHGISVIAGGCTMMFLDPVDLGHRCMRWILGATGKLPDGGIRPVVPADARRIPEPLTEP
jgi:uncharacterized protein